MIVLNAFATRQHGDSSREILHALADRGCDIKSVYFRYNDHGQRHSPYDLVNTDDCQVTIVQSPHLAIHTPSSLKGFKVCVEHGIGPVPWAFPLVEHDKLDLVLVQSQYHMNLVNKAMPSLAPKCVLTGWPKLDRLVAMDRQAARAALVSKLGLDPGKPIIAFCPSQNRSYIHAPALVDLNIPNLVIAPHEGDYAWFHGKNRAHRSDPVRDFRKIKGYLETSNIYEVIAAADLIIGDYSSCLAESLVYDTPIIQLLAPGGLHNRTSDPMKMGGYELPFGTSGNTGTFTVGPMVRDVKKELMPLIEKMLVNKSIGAKEREVWRNNLIYKPDGKRAGEAADVIFDRMKKKRVAPSTSCLCKLCATPAKHVFSKKVTRRGFEDKVFEYFQCATCGLMFSNGMDAFTDEEFSRWYSYPEYLTIDHFAVRSYRNERVLVMVQHVLLHGKGIPKRILLTGNGSLTVHLALEHAGFDVWMTYASFDHPKHVKPSEIEGKFDIIVGNEVFEHFTDPMGEMKWIAEHLAPGGYVLGSTGITDMYKGPALESWAYVDSRCVNAGHICLWSWRSLEFVAKVLGLKNHSYPGSDMIRRGGGFPAYSGVVLYGK